MGWFDKLKAKAGMIIDNPPAKQIKTPDNASELWKKCPACGETILMKDLILPVECICINILLE